MPPKAAAAKPKKKANGYARPADVALGTVLTDTHKQSWKVGPSIGSGGFGEIYSCCSAASPPKKTEDYPNVVKIVSRRVIWQYVIYNHFILGTPRQWAALCGDAFLRAKL